MKAFLRSSRISPKKANLVAKLVRGLTVVDALDVLAHTNKKGARILEELIKSAASNASHNDKQNTQQLIVRELIVNKAQAFDRGIPMARGRMRRIRKFMSHISVDLGLPEIQQENSSKKSPETVKEADATKATKSASKTSESSTSSASSKKSPSQAAKKPVKSSGSSTKKKPTNAGAKKSAPKSTTSTSKKS